MARRKSRENARQLMAPRARLCTWAELSTVCRPTLAGAIADLTAWNRGRAGRSWRPGDYAFLVVETAVAPDAVLYVQFWSEPLDPVLWEVCSGSWNPGARRFVRGRPRQRILEMGFTAGGAARNFQKRLDITTRREAGRVARETLRVFFDAFGYRGTTSLLMKTLVSNRVDELDLDLVAPGARALRAAPVVN
jgi:hypothetical protein